MADVYIGGEPYLVHDESKTLEHEPCGAILFGDNSRANHTCYPCAGCGDHFTELPVVDSENGERFCTEDCHEDASERYWTAVWSA